jgi:uncharacterized protein YbcI
MKNTTRGEAESEISQAIIKFEREYMGRGPEDAKTRIFDDVVFVRLQGVLTPAEKHLAKTEDSTAGRKLIKEVRQELLEKARVQGKIDAHGHQHPHGRKNYRVYA